MTPVQGRVSDDLLRSNGRIKEVARKLSKLLALKFGEGVVNINIPPYRFTRKAHVISTKKFTSSQAMEPYIEYLQELGVECSKKDPNERKFEISLAVTFEFILNHFGEREYEEAVRISKG